MSPPIGSRIEGVESLYRGQSGQRIHPKVVVTDSIANPIGQEETLFIMVMRGLPGVESSFGKELISVTANLGDLRQSHQARIA